MGTMAVIRLFCEAHRFAGMIYRLQQHRYLFYFNYFPVSKKCHATKHHRRYRDVPT